ncbi:MAG: TonB-dependent receptor [Bacteroidales bacterium]|nr:TonB-dependent receptor [Bacteroidales bacterium]
MLLASVVVTYAQNTVRGVVISATDQEPIIGATVLEKGSLNGTVTDLDGQFTLAVKNNAVLVVSYVGFTTQEIATEGRSDFRVVLAEDNKLLDDVVVVGYGTMKKSDLTGAVASANIKAFEKSPNTNVLQSLQGTVPGLNVGQASSAGSDPSITVRGTNTISGNSSVLVVLDGIIYTGGLSSLNPADIQSVDVLKDASATAVYGAQAANGVLLITTKKGAKGKAKVSFQSSYSIQKPTKDLHTMNREEMLNFDNECLWLYSKTEASGYTQQDPNFNLASRMPDSWMTDSQGNIVPGDYDWWSDFTRNGHIQENKLNISGGSDAMSYLISVGNTTQKNYLLNDDYKRNSIRVNLDIQPTKWLKAGVQAFGSFENRDGQETYLPFLIECSPLTHPYDENGVIIDYPAHDARENPYHGSLVDDYDRNNSFFANLYAEVQLPLKGLTYRVNYGNNYRIGEHNYASEYAENNNGQAYKHHSTYYDYTLDNIVNYSNDFGKHNVGATFVYGASRRKYSYTAADAKLFPRMTLGYNSLELASTQTTNSDAWLETLLYQMYRVNYSYDSRYLLTATLRRDGFSGFSANNKSAVFPSVALGWVITNEDWFKVAGIDYLKLRAGWGVSGNQTSRYSSLAKVNSSIGYIFGDGVSGAMRQELASMENADLKWEKTSGLNFGLDFAVLNNRISGNIEYYQTTTKDLLYAVSIPSITGFTSIMSNVGEIKNRGFEITLNTQNIKTRDFEWTTQFNLSMNRNEITKLAGLDTDGDGKEDDLTSSSLFIGESLSAIYDYTVDGIYQVGDNIPDGYHPGNYRIVDINNDGKIDENDRSIIGRTDPAVRMGMLNTFRYKGITLSFFLNSVLGGDKSYQGKNSYAELVNDNTLRHNRLTEQVDNFWTPSNPDGIFALYHANPAINPFRYENRSFVRLQDITLSYDLPATWMKKIGMDGINLYVSGKNLLTFTGWNGWDPEPDMTYQDINGQNRRTGSRYEDRPIMKSVTFGININF